MFNRRKRGTERPDVWHRGTGVMRRSNRQFFGKTPRDRTTYWARTRPPVQPDSTRRERRNDRYTPL